MVLGVFNVRVRVKVFINPARVWSQIVQPDTAELFINIATNMKINKSAAV